MNASGVALGASGADFGASGVDFAAFVSDSVASGAESVASDVDLATSHAYVLSSAMCSKCKADTPKWGLAVYRPAASIIHKNA